MSSPSYGCSHDCNFFLHQPCTELPQSSSRRIGGSLYQLNLLPKPLHDNCNCEKCGNLCKNFTYEYEEYYFGKTIYFQCQCIFPLEISIKHISHHLHSLMAVCKEASLVCDACGRKQTGTFFCCQKCSFYIHQDCCLVPSIAKINNHHHLLSLNYSLSNFFIAYKKCLICDDDISYSFGAYVCDYCFRGAHLNCAASTMEETATVQASIILPMVPDTFPSLIIRTFLKNREDAEVEDVKLKIEKCHSNHSSWVLHHQGSDIQLVCNACVQPIISPSPHYRCPQPNCDFLLHQFCANLPPDVKNYFVDESRHFFSESIGFCSVFKCCMCDKQCNGFGYKLRGWSVDVECAAAPIIIKHESHGQHPLRLSLSGYLRSFCCDGLRRSIFVYYCMLCNYQIHVRCAFLPKTVKHKFDEHPLDLIYNPTSQIPHEADKEKEQHYLCEFCEKDVDPKFWFYYCGKCDQSFHVNCIPSTGELSKIKFGYNLGLPRDVHDHPVILTRMLTMGSQRCGFCEDMIQGFEDGMAFHCSMCDFWIHFRCAKKISQEHSTPSTSESE